jgi:hypothetical protein
MITKLSLLLPPDSPITFASTFVEYLEMLPKWDRTLFAEHSKYIDVDNRVVNRLWQTVTACL